MARSDTLMKAGIAGLVLWVGGDVALHGAFGAAAQNAVQSIVSTLGIHVSATVNPTTGSTASGTTGAVYAPMKPAPCDTSFQPGVRYVGLAPEGGYGVWINGHMVYQSNSLNDAQTYYNAHVCASS